MHCHKLAFIVCLTFDFLITRTIAVTEIQPLIVGGNEVDIDKYPYLASIRYRLVADGPYWHKCAGVIISTNAILTAAQCLRHIQSDRVMVVVGANQRTGADGVQYTASKWIGHTKFSTYTGDYDVGLVFVDVPFDLDNKSGGMLRMITIRKQRPAVGHLSTIVGWGYREEFGPSSKNLEEAKVPIVSTSECVSIYGKGEVTERMICAGYVANGGRDACQGDTGGPLVFNGELVGLVSWGRGCARPGYPSVYTYVESLRSWIKEQLEKANNH